SIPPSFVSVPRPPISPVSPYTTLFRSNRAFTGRTSSLDVAGLEIIFQGDVPDPATPMKGVEASVAIPKLAIDPHKLQLQIEKLRSEEHTSELQSRENLVCRLLLETNNQ